NGQDGCPVTLFKRASFRRIPNPRRGLPLRGFFVAQCGGSSVRLTPATVATRPEHSPPPCNRRRVPEGVAAPPGGGPGRPTPRWLAPAPRHRRGRSPPRHPGRG